MRRFFVISIILFLVAGTAQNSEAVDKVFLRWIYDKPVIDSIVIDGNDNISDGVIRSQMYSKVRSIWSVIKGDRRSRLQRETLTRDTMEIKYLYLKNGYLGVQVDESFEMIDIDSTARIRVIVNEGKKFVYGNLSLTGDFDPKFRDGMNGKMNKLKQGKPVNPFEMLEVVFEMKTILANNGYPYASIEFIIDTITSPPTTPINFNVQSDSIVYFGELEIEGVQSYPYYVARREVTIKEGDIYKRDKIVDSKRRLFESGYFSFPQLEQSPNSIDRFRPDFTLKIRERKPRFISVTTGAAQSEVRDLQWDFSTGFGKRNLFGSRKFNIFADYSFSVGHEVRLITHRYRARYTEPWFLGIRMPLSLTGEYEPPLRSKFQNYRIRSYAFSVSTLKRIGAEIRINTGLEYNNVKITDFRTGSEELIRQEEGISIQRKMYANFRLDSRDNIFVPRRGSVTELSTEYYGGFLGGDDSFTKLKASWSTYQVLWPGWTGAIRLQAGRAKQFGSSPFVPSEERFYLGGANSVRGFSENSLGPFNVDTLTNTLGETVIDSSAAGANYKFLFNIEFRWKTIQVLSVVPVINSLFKNFPLWQSVFIDVGNGYNDPDEVSFNSLAYGYGTGIQILSPAGPIRIDYARSIKTERYLVASRWHFTILYAF